MRGRLPDPDVSVYCRCGAQWHGRHAVGNNVIDHHAKRCGPAIAQEIFEALGYKPKPNKQSASYAKNEKL